MVRAAAAFGVVGLLFFGIFWHFVTGPTRIETAEMQTRIDALLQENAQAQAAEQRLNEFRASYTRVQAEYEDLKALLPERRELTMVLANIQDRARGQLSLMKFAPGADEQQDFYSSKLIEVGVSGSYNKLGEFFSQMASYQRIVSITDFKLSGLDKKKAGDKDQLNKGRTVNAEFKLKAYYASPERVQAAVPLNAAKPAAAAAQPKAN
jgi:Tfp pilus assembly protein PilO